MKILMVLSSKTFPPDGRVEREARDLIKDNHQVYMMARRGENQAKAECYNNINVIRVPLPFQGKKAVSDLIYFFLQRYVIFFHIVNACKKNGIDVLHVHDLPYALATVLAAKVLKIPVVFDMHEYYAVMLKMSFEARSYRKFKPFAFILLWLLKIEEKYACKNASKVILVADEHIERILFLGVKRNNIMIVTNTEDIDHFSNLSDDPAILTKYQNEFIILYVGGFSPHRGLDTAIDAMPNVLKQIPNARLLLVGDGNNRKELEELVKDQDLKACITFTGFQKFEKLPSYIKICDIGLIPHISTPHIETTMPNKIFQFMMLGKPVIVSSTKPMMRIVEETKCGWIFKERDSDDLARAIIEAKESSQIEILGKNGKAAVEKKYNWQKTVEPLLELYRDDSAFFMTEQIHS